MQNENKLKVFIVSYKKNNKWNDIVYPVEKRFKKHGFKTEKVEGYYLPNHPEIKRTQIVYKNFLDKVMPKALKYIKKNPEAKGVLVAEDDAWLNDTVTNSYLDKKLKASGAIMRVGYQKILKEKNKKYIVGTQLIWVPKKSINKLINVMKETRPQHLNGFMSKTKKVNIKIMNQSMKNKLVSELEHLSLTTGKTRKGLKITKKKPHQI